MALTPGHVHYLSHSARWNSHVRPIWWIVEPRDGPNDRLAAEIRSLLAVGRRVLQVVIHERGAEIHEVFPDTADIMLRHLEEAK